MRMVRLSLIMLGICVSIDLRYATPGAKNLFVHSPPRLSVQTGANATFTCNISALNYNPDDFNWYKTGDTSTKIADLKSQTNKLLITINWDRREAVLHISNVTFNDSGKYYCSHLNLSGNEQIIVSNTSELFVNSSKSIPIAVPNDNNNSRPTESSLQPLNMFIISTSVILVLLLFLAIGSAKIFIWYKQRNNIPEPQQQHLGKLPQDHSVYTVDYGILEFGASQPYRKSQDLSQLDQVEYATIMFPQQTPSLGEKRGKSL
ncbi:uncharacterized protein LOC130360673 isoform X2 [Hyla sarda]|uniref:uncharacterized protein LOC130360673 isoform X2 n=1 Tax=Hyla sarda TaxID=327740 RepID=UPI0024C39FBA|nr:uncharacterized protein LOC130360673 isoform X2 [Hyla sarda]